MKNLLFASSVMCAGMLVLGLGILPTIGSSFTGLCELVAVASGIMFVGLVEDR